MLGTCQVSALGSLVCAVAVSALHKVTNRDVANKRDLCKLELWTSTTGISPLHAVKCDCVRLPRHLTRELFCVYSPFVCANQHLRRPSIKGQHYSQTSSPSQTHCNHQRNFDLDGIAHSLGQCHAQTNTLLSPCRAQAAPLPCRAQAAPLRRRCPCTQARLLE